jgi:hypothetical protein
LRWTGHAACINIHGILVEVCVVNTTWEMDIDGRIREVRVMCLYVFIPQSSRRAFVPIHPSVHTSKTDEHVLRRMVLGFCTKSCLAVLNLVCTDLI